MNICKCLQWTCVHGRAKEESLETKEIVYKEPMDGGQEERNYFQKSYLQFASQLLFTKTDFL